MSDISDKAEELTGDDELRAEGTVDQAGAQLKQGIEAVADKAQEVTDDAAAQLSDARDKAADTAHRLHLDDSRLVIAALAGIAVVAALAIRRTRRTSRSTHHPVAKKVAAAGVARALTR